MGQVIRQVIEMNLLASNMNGDIGLVLSNLWNSLIHPRGLVDAPLSDG
jgi:hypothetical protein